MNKKGVFSALLATAAIIVIAATIIASSAPAMAPASKDFPGTILEMKRDWSNTRYLLDKTTSDYLADNLAYDGSCNATGVNNLNGISGYFNTTIGAYPNCSYETLVPGFSAPDVTITLTITCSKDLGDFTASFSDSVIFEKQIAGFGSSPACSPRITDLQSGEIEVS